LIPGFAKVRAAALREGALGCSISGAGPTIFAWSLEAGSIAVRDAMVREFAAEKIEVDSWVITIGSNGARLVATEG
jgi:homoserine kinase